MNLELVFVKTAAGEEVLASPDKNGGEGGRLPRAFRTVLILVDGKLTVDDYIDSIPFHYDDIKKAYSFFNDTNQLEENRQKQLQIAIAAKQAEKDSQTAATQAEKDNSAAVDTQEAGIISNSEKSSAENQ